MHTDCKEMWHKTSKQQESEQIWQNKHAGKPFHGARQFYHMNN